MFGRLVLRPVSSLAIPAADLAARSPARRGRPGSERRTACRPPHLAGSSRQTAAASIAAYCPALAPARAPASLTEYEHHTIVREHAASRFHVQSPDFPSIVDSTLVEVREVYAALAPTCTPAVNEGGEDRFERALLGVLQAKHRDTRDRAEPARVRHVLDQHSDQLVPKLSPQRFSSEKSTKLVWYGRA